MLGARRVRLRHGLRCGRVGRRVVASGGIIGRSVIGPGDPAGGRDRLQTQRNTALVRALFGQICAAVAHASAAKGTVRCPADFGVSYFGTFYDGSRTLAKFVYGATGCQSVSLTADGKTRSTMVLGAASAAAPKLRADMAAVLGVPTTVMAQPKSQSGNAGPSKLR